MLIVFLTARNEEYCEIAAFDAGADVYILKPFRPRALTARIKALLRRNIAKDDKVKHEFIDLKIKPQNHEVTVNGKPVHLPKKEIKLLEMLAGFPGRLFIREEQ